MRNRPINFLQKMTSFETALGTLTFQASVELEADGVIRIAFEEKKPSQRLPDGMTVDRWRAVVVSISSNMKIRCLTFQCRLENSEVRGDPCTGEALEAQEWEGTQSLVVVGTEDGDWLNARMPFLDCKGEAIVDYSPQSMELELRGIPPCDGLSLHFVVAENPSPEPVECSAWFAVDCPHALLI